MIAWMRRAHALRALVQASVRELTDEALAALDAEGFDAWRPGAAYQAGQVVAHGDGLYRVEQAHTGQAHQPPGGVGMLAVYRPIQAQTAEGIAPWMNGEAVEIGDRRGYNGKVYEAYAPVGANLWPPDTAPSIWKYVT
ncbi:MAG: hypothetical protein LBU67_02120 [Oscillospiraceae bacterium]|jgi:hypothetical protein|nr:hypothetical protein [Oscillospiraceae bacterium]